MPMSLDSRRTNCDQPVLISFSGMDGSGKSTQIETLCCQLVDAGIPVMRLAFWDNVVGLSKWRAAFSHKFLKSEARVIVFDRYIYDQLATLPLEYAAARAYARWVLSFVPKPDVAYLLDAEPEVARERKPEYPVDFL